MNLRPFLRGIVDNTRGTPKRGGLVRTLCLVSAMALPVCPTLAQSSTTFTYQGQLQQQDQPYSGTADYSFTLWDALSGGSQIGAALPAPGVTVSAGLFTTSLDFGAGAVAGQRYLQVAVRTPAWDGEGQEPAFTTLDPRQPITASPYAVQTRGIFVNEAGRVGINTTQPAGVISNARLDVAGGHVVVDNNFGVLSENAAGTGIGAGFDTRPTDWLDLFAGGLARATLTSTGLFGLGTTNPQRTLDVVGNARFGGPGAVIELGDSNDDTVLVRGELELDGDTRIRFPDGTAQSTAAGLEAVTTQVFVPSFFLPDNGQIVLNFSSVNGALPGGAVILTPPYDLWNFHAIAFARVTGVGTVTARIISNGGGDRTYSGATWRITIIP